MNKKITASIIIIVVVLGGLYYLNGKKKTIEEPLTQVINTHKGDKQAIKDTNTAINYNTKVKLEDLGDLKKYGEYKNLTGFLKVVQKNVTGINLNLLKDDFVICLTGENGKKIYVPFYNSDIKKGYYDTGTVMYSYMSYIDKGIKNGCIYGGIHSNAESKVLFERDFRNKHSDILDNIFNRRTNVYETITELEKVRNKSKDYKQLLAYLYDFVGDYEKSLKIKEQSSKKTTLIDMKGVVLDQDNKPIAGAKLYLLNDPKYKVITNAKGEYKLNFKYYPFSHLRFKVSKQGYSDGYFTLPLDYSQKPDWNKKIDKTFHLVKAKNELPANWWGVKKPDIVLNGKKYYIFKTKQSIYHVPIDGLYYKDGTHFEKGKVTVYLYEFNKWSKIDDLMQSDTFSPVYGYVGNLMKTFGMPYIQFFDAKGRELFVRRSNPMLLINKIYHMKELYENYDKIYTAITEQDMQYLYEFSKKGGYPITYNWLIQNNFLRWPTWWTLEREKGTWISIPHKVISPKGIVQLKFWQINK